MKILLVVDGSSYSSLAANMIQALKPSPKTEVIVITVVPEYTLLGGATLGKIKPSMPARKKLQEEKADELLQYPVQLLGKIGLKVESRVYWGNPSRVILKAARESDASLVVMGAKGITDSAAFRLGSVSETVMKQANTSVLLVRKKISTLNRNLKTEDSTIDLKRTLLATDGSKYADKAAQLLLELPLPSSSQVTIVTALQSYAAVTGKTPSPGSETDKVLLSSLQEIEESKAKHIVTLNEEKFRKNGYEVNSLLLRGGARESILKAAEKNDADLVSLGSRGLSGIRALFLGSVAEGVARYAPCSVLIVK